MNYGKTIFACMAAAAAVCATAAEPVPAVVPNPLQMFDPNFTPVDTATYTGTTAKSALPENKTGHEAPPVSSRPQRPVDIGKLRAASAASPGPVENIPRHDYKIAARPVDVALARRASPMVSEPSGKQKKLYKINSQGHIKQPSAGGYVDDKHRATPRQYYILNPRY